MKYGHRQVRPLPVILPPLADELLSSWVARHAAFIGVSGLRLLRHCNIEVKSVRDIDFMLVRRDVSTLAEALRCSPHLIRNMAQFKGARVRNRLVAITRPLQICPRCAGRHAADPGSRGARLRSWMEGWRISCPICGTTLEDFSLYTRLFRADPADPLLMSIERNSRDGERIMDRASRRRIADSTHHALMRSMSLPRAEKPRMTAATMAAPRLLDLVVPEAGDFFRRLQPENWPGSARFLPLSIRIPVLAGVARVSSRPERWIDELAGAVTPPHQTSLLQCLRALPASDHAGPYTP